MKNKTTYSCISVRSDYYLILKKLAQKKKVSVREYSKDMILFFKSTRIDPEEIDGYKINLQKELKDLKDTFISFIRKQESEHIIPIKENQQLGFQETILRLENLIETMTDLPRNHQMEQAFKMIKETIRNQ